MKNSSKEKTIILTGGGTAGHVSLNLALIPTLQELGWDVHYLGRKEGIERDLLAPYSQVTYHPIPAGKFRRDKSWSSFKANFRDLGHVFSAIRQSKKIIQEVQPRVIFSKGGFVSVPVVIGGGRSKVPVVSHESDLTPGLANKVAMRYSKKILVTFKETLNYLKPDQGIYVGPVIRRQIQGGDRNKGLETFGFSGEKPVLFLMGGSMGSKRLNETLRENLPTLLKKFDILHACGKGWLDPGLDQTGYVQREFISEELKDALAMADLVVSRSGANAIFEFLYYNIPMVLVPLVKGSRGDQVQNAKIFKDRGYARVLEEDRLEESFLPDLKEAWDQREEIAQAQKSFDFPDSQALILKEIYRTGGLPLEDI